MSEIERDEFAEQYGKQWLYLSVLVVRKHRDNKLAAYATLHSSYRDALANYKRSVFVGEKEEHPYPGLDRLYEIVKHFHCPPFGETTPLAPADPGYIRVPELLFQKWCCYALPIEHRLVAKLRQKLSRGRYQKIPNKIFLEVRGASDHLGEVSVTRHWWINPAEVEAAKQRNRLTIKERRQKAREAQQAKQAARLKHKRGLVEA